MEDVICQYDRHAQLIATPQVQVDASRIIRARREAGVEGRLVAIIVHPKARWLFEHERTADIRRLIPGGHHQPRHADQRDKGCTHHSNLLLFRCGRHFSKSLPRSTTWPAPTFRSSRFSSNPGGLSNDTDLMR